MRTPLASLDGRYFDVAVIGAGVVGASAAQHLAAAGYDVLLVEQGDFASGSSSRSTRLLHCGLRYLAPGKSMAEFFLHPSRLATALRMARQAMQSRAQFVRATPQRAKPMTVGFPIWQGGRYSPWQVNVAFRLLQAFGPKDVPLDHRRLSPQQAASDPLLQYLRDRDRLIEVAQFREYQFEWPERIAVDAVLDAERMGASVRNYTRCIGLTREGDAWRIRLQDALAPVEQAEVGAKQLVNAAGIWIDRVNAQAGGGARRKITGTKGVHIMVRLPPECRDRGIATLNRLNEGLYCVPWRGMHYFGPTETLYEGDIDDIRPEEADISFLLDEANHLLPTLRLKRADVLFAWAGVRPLTYNPDLPTGNRSRELHDLGLEGMPGALAMTAGPVMTHRGAGQEITAAVQRRLPPSRAPQPLSYAARLFPE
ncbi:MAG: FAD-dependent oxidoreductase, partial [Acidisphaera sp.]|nr:FAD-dependent oxidoreductase [Acidisphaera sp.]